MTLRKRVRVLQTFLSYTLRLILILAFFSGASNTLAEQNKLTEFQIQALETAALLEANTFPRDSEIVAERAKTIRNTPQLEHVYTRFAIFDGFDGTSDVSFIDQVNAYHTRAVSFGNPSDLEVANLFTGLTKVYFPYETEERKGSLAALNYLDQYHESENWEAAHISIILSAVLLYSSATTVYLHAKLKNPEMMVSSLKKLVNGYMEIGAPVPTANFYNNMLYALRAENNPDFVRPLVQGFLRVGAIRPPAINGLIERQSQRGF